MAIFIKPTPIDLEIKKREDYPAIRDALGRTGIKVRHRSIQSDNYVPGTTGWIIRANGTIEAITIVAGSYITSFVQDAIPTSLHIGDLWIKTDAGNKVYRAASVGADQIAAGKWIEYGTLANWSEVVDDGAKPDDNADVTGDNTANNTNNIKNTDAPTAESRFNTLFQRFVFVGSINDGLTETEGTGTLLRNLITSAMYSGQASSCSLTSAGFSSEYASSINMNWAKNFEFIATSLITPDDAKDVFIGVCGIVAEGFGTTVPADATSTQQHIGFFVQDTTLYASNANGTSQTKTEITGINLSAWNTYRFVKGSSDIKFYVNDVLKATHTTNRPSSNNIPKLFLGIESQHADVQVLFVSNNYSTFITR